MAKSKKGYLGLDSTISLILAIIPVTSYVLGFVTRFMEKKIVAGILRIIIGFPVIWVIDLVMMIKKGNIWRFLNV